MKNCTEAEIVFAFFCCQGMLDESHEWFSVELKQLNLKKKRKRNVVELFDIGAKRNNKSPFWTLHNVGKCRGQDKKSE